MAEKKVPVTAEPELIQVIIPAQYKGDTERYVAVNGQRLLVKTNTPVYLPKRFAEVIKNSQAMDAEAQRYIEMMETA